MKHFEYEAIETKCERIGVKHLSFISKQNENHSFFSKLTVSETTEARETVIFVHRK